MCWSRKITVGYVVVQVKVARGHGDTILADSWDWAMGFMEAIHAFQTRFPGRQDW